MQFPDEIIRPLAERKAREDGYKKDPQTYWHWACCDLDWQWRCGSTGPFAKIQEKMRKDSYSYDSYYY